MTASQLKTEVDTITETSLIANISQIIAIRGLYSLNLIPDIQ